MGWTAEDLTKLEDAMKTGVRKVSYQDKGEVEYNSFDDMRKLRDLMRSELGLTSKQSVRIPMKYSKGL